VKARQGLGVLGRPGVAPAVFLALVLALFFWPVWALGYESPPPSGDTWKQLYPVWSYIGQNVRRGVLPLWNVRMMGGDPIVGEPQYGLFNLLNWPLFLMSPISDWAVTLRAALPLLLGGVGMCVYLSRSPVWRLGRPAALVGSVAYMLSDSFIVHLGHPQFNDVLGWLPWCLLAVDRVVETPRAIVPASIPFLMTAAAGHAQAALYATFAVSLYGLWRVVDGPRTGLVRRAVALLATGVITMGLAAPILLPAIERYPHTERAALSVVPATGYQWRLDTLLDLLSPHFHGRGSEGLWMTGGRIETGYVGAGALFLALLGLAADRRRRRTWFLVLLAVLAVLLALGYNGPLFPLLARLDVVARLEKTARAAALVSFALAAGAALGVEHLLASERLRRAGFAVLLILAAALWRGSPTIAQLIPADDRQMRAVGALRAAAGLAALLAFTLLLLRRRVWAAAIIALLAGELIVGGAFVEAEAPSPPVDHNAALGFLQADSGWFRVDVDSEAVELWPPHLLVAEGFAVPRTVGNPMELRGFNLLYWGQPSKTSVGYRVLGVKYIVVAKDAPPGGEGIVPVFVNDPLVDIHLHTSSLQRAWLVYDTIAVDDPGEAMTVMSEPGFDPVSTATIEGGEDLDGDGEGWIGLLAYEPNRVALEIHTSAPAFLILSDVLYPGWEATVDGEETELYPADGVFRGVEIPAGDHHLEMTYRPLSLRWGLIVAATTVLMIVTVPPLLVTLRRRRGGAAQEQSLETEP